MQSMEPETYQSSQTNLNQVDVLSTNEKTAYKSIRIIQDRETCQDRS